MLNSKSSRLNRQQKCGVCVELNIAYMIHDYDKSVEIDRKNRGGKGQDSH
jgi:hypothetical protein